MPDWFEQNKPTKDDWFGQNTPGDNPAPGDVEGRKRWMAERYPQTQQKPEEQSSPVSRFASSFIDSVNPLPLLKRIATPPEPPKSLSEVPAALGKLAMGPLGPVVVDLVKGQIDQGKKSYDALKRGEYSEAGGRALAAILPGVGPMAARAGEQIGEGDVAGGLGTVAGIAVPVAAGKVLRAARVPENIPIPKLSRRLYQSSLKPQTGSALSEAQRAKIIETGIRERIPVSEGGLNKTASTVDALNQEVAGKLAARSDELGPVISPEAVASRVDEVKPTFRQQVNPEADMNALEASRQEFLRQHSENQPYTKIEPSPEGGYVPVEEVPNPVEQPLTLSGAQAEKTGTYRQLRKKYGELGSAQTEAQKALARGLKEEIYNLYPELKDLGAREGALIDLEGQLSRFVAREGNKQLGGIGTPITAGAAHAAGLPALPVAIVKSAMEWAPIKSRLAIALDRANTAARRSTRSAGAASSAYPFVRTEESDPYSEQ